MSTAFVPPKRVVQSLFAFMVVLLLANCVGGSGTTGPSTEPTTVAKIGLPHVVTGSSVVIPPGESRSGNASCPIGETALGGGFDFSGNNLLLRTNTPLVVSTDPAGWEVTGVNPDAGEQTLTVTVICAIVI